MLFRNKTFSSKQKLGEFITIIVLEKEVTQAEAKLDQMETKIHGKAERTQKRLCSFSSWEADIHLHIPTTPCLPGIGLFKRQRQLGC